MERHILASDVSLTKKEIPAYRAAYTPEGEAWVHSMMAYIAENYHMTDSFFRERLPCFKAVKPEGTFILWVDARSFCSDAQKLQEFLNERALFHVDPGVQYGGDPGFFRMTLSLPRAELYKALESLENAVKLYGSP